MEGVSFKRKNGRAMWNALVTGGAGFLGSHLSRLLLDQGHSVVVLDDLSTGSFTNLPDHPRLTKVKGDVARGWEGKVDRIYHLACPASPPKYQIDPVKTLDTNYQGTRNMLELALRSGARLLLTSTSEIYGDPQVSPQAETYWGNVNTFGPRSCYDEGKRVAESLCYAYSRYRQADVRVARIFNTYGPFMAPDDGRVVTNFISQALEGKPITIYGSGNQTRSLCYVDDLIRGLNLLMESTSPPVDAPVNLGNPNEMTIRQIAELVLELTGSNSPLIECPLPQDDPKQRCPDISRAYEWLGWRPMVSARDGIKRTCDYFEGALRLS
ncbi:MAG: SDR family oxidoreductase [Candidatus Eremiobacteraeota bacterium]|nr:SDR family oxidoreductase [Candidatus Eremiobacteraeota bacterium]